MILTTEEWVRRLNKLAREMAVWENSLHPSAWAEQNAELIRKWKELAACQTYDPPIQMELKLEQ